MAFNIQYNIIASDQFSATAEKVRSQLKGIQTNLNDLGKGGAGAGMSGLIHKFHALHAAILAIGVEQAFEKIIHAGTRYQDSLIDLSAQLGMTGEHLKELAEKGEVIGKKFNLDGNEVNHLMKDLAQLNPELAKNTDELLSMTQQVALLAKATGTELGASATYVTRLMKLFGAQANEAAKYVNILAFDTKQGGGNLETTADALMMAGRAAKLTGVSFEEMNAIFNLLIKSGFEGPRVGRAVQRMFALMQKGNTDFKKQGFAKTFELDAAKILRIKDASTRQQALTKAFGDPAMGQALINNAKNLGVYLAEIEKTRAAEELWGIRREKFSEQVTRLGNSIENKLEETFIRLEPELKKMVMQFEGWLDSLTPEDIKAFTDGLLLILQTMIEMLKVANLLAGAFGPIADIARVFKGISGAAMTIDQQLKETTPKQAAILSAQGINSTSEINVNINAPEGVVKSVTSASDGSSKLNLGHNRRAVPVGAY